MNASFPRRAKKEGTAQEHQVCCSVLQCVAVRCSALQCVAVCCSVLQCVEVSRGQRKRDRLESVESEEPHKLENAPVAVCCSC